MRNVLPARLAIATMRPAPSLRFQAIGHIPATSPSASVIEERRLGRRLVR
jgi:hypothetical protein